VRIHRSGVNPTDWKARQGGPQSVPLSAPQTPNQDGSGVVDAVGEGVDRAVLGRRVWVWEAAHAREEGTAQEYAIVPARHVVDLADTASFDLGASLGVPFLTAHRCLTVAEDGPRRLGPGTMQSRVVLVAGGAGAVGNAAIQLARWSDATVIATVSSPAKANLAAAAGADHVIDYTAEDVRREVRKIAPAGVNHVAEVAAAENAALDASLLAPLGSVAVYADNGGDQLTLPIRTGMTVNARWQFVLVYTMPARAKAEAVEDVTAAVIDEAVGVGEDAGLPVRHFSLADTARAHEAVQNSITGKVIIDVDESTHDGER